MEKVCKNPTIKSWAKEDRPREKLLTKGEHLLSNSELLAILLRTGSKGESALDLARRIIHKFGTFRSMSRADTKQWQEFKGLGTAKLAQVKAAVEIGRRFGEEQAAEKGFKIKSSRDAADILMPRLRDLTREVFKVLMLDAKNTVIDIEEVEEGTVNCAHPVLREIFQRALRKCTVSLICAHNHPSGDPGPSREDRDFTRDLCQAAQIMQIRMLDHIIIGDNEYYSFADAGEL